VYQEFDTNHAVNVSDDDQMFKYINTWREAVNEEILDMNVKNEEVANNQVVQADIHQAELSNQTPLNVNVDIQADHSNPMKIMEQHRDLLSIAQIPKLEIMTFNGEPLKYWPFIRSFENAVDKLLVDDSAELYRLIQYCTGKALKVISCCLLMDPVTGFDKAKNLLKERFGYDFVIAEAYIPKVVSSKHRAESNCSMSLMN